MAGDLAQSISRVLKSPGFKFALIGGLILILLIPLVIVAGLVSEREQRAIGVRAGVARVWGAPQVISGPFLVVPYTVNIEVQQGDKRVVQLVERRAVFLPELLDIAAGTASQILSRSIYDVNVYTAKTAISGRFTAPDFSTVESAPVEIRWRDAILALALSDVSGLKTAASIKIDALNDVPFQPSIGVPGVMQNGIHVRLATAALTGAKDGLKAFSFEFPLVFSGSTSLSFAPAAQNTTIALNADWPHPSFDGAFLPVERVIDGNGFKASWRIPHLARSVPGAWSLTDTQLDRFQPYTFGVTYYLPVDFYDLVSRAVKYAVLFLSLAFMAVFVLELRSGKTVHSVQYLFVGIAMSFFYVLLLSLAEHIGFSAAYIAASAATGGMLALYVGKSLASLRSGLLMLAAFSGLFAILFMILRLEDYALLAGALLGFTALTAIMFATLNVDWSGQTSNRSQATH